MKTIPYFRPLPAEKMKMMVFAQRVIFQQTTPLFDPLEFFLVLEVCSSVDLDREIICDDDPLQLFAGRLDSPSQVMRPLPPLDLSRFFRFFCLGDCSQKPRIKDPLFARRLSYFPLRICRVLLN